jgi:hypothetical protein
VNEATRHHRAALCMSFLMWLLLQSGENWSWVIIGGFDAREQCQRARAAHVIASEFLVCARTDPPASLSPVTPVAPRGEDRRRGPFFESSADLAAAPRANPKAR